MTGHISVFMSGNTAGNYWAESTGMLSACNAQDAPTRNYSVQNVNSTNAEKSCSIVWLLKTTPKYIACLNYHQMDFQNW